MWDHPDKALDNLLAERIMGWEQQISSGRWIERNGEEAYPRPHVYTADLSHPPQCRSCGAIVVWSPTLWFPHTFALMKRLSMAGYMTRMGIDTKGQHRADVIRIGGGFSASGLHVTPLLSFSVSRAAYEAWANAPDQMEDDLTRSRKGWFSAYANG